MEKFYRLLDWLDTSQAVDWLQDLTKTPINFDGLLQLSESGQCQAYADVSGLQGEDMTNFKTAQAQGIHKVLNPLSVFGSNWPHNEAWTEGDVAGSKDVSWVGTLAPWSRGPLFKPADIQALADKMNGVTEQCNEVKGLREQLEQERAAKESAESEALELRQQRGTDTLAGIRHLLHDDIEYRSLLERAEAAERMIESMDELLREQAEKIKRDGKLIKHMAARLDGAPSAEQQESKTTTEGLVFPYATKQLEAMRDAASQFWQAHDRTKSAPYGIQKLVKNFLIDHAGGNARKAVELAAAIKPDDLPKI